jgi:tight adherence protein C
MTMPLSIWLAAIAVACAAPLAWWALGGTRSSRAQVRKNLAAGGQAFTDLRRNVLEQRAHDRVTAPAMQYLAQRARRITPAGIVDALQRRIVLAGLSETWSVDRLLAFKLVGVLTGGFVGLAMFISEPSLMRLLFFALVAGLGWFAPDVSIARKADDRQREIERALADALDQITVCVESGLSFEAAVARVADGSGPLAEELARVLEDIHIGIPRDRALENLLERTDIADVRAFVHAFMHGERYGIPIAQVLRAQSGEMRDKRRQRAEERAMKIPVKLVFPLTLCILPALFIVVAGPAVVRISDSFGI